MSHDDNGDWTVVDYRRGRDKRRDYKGPQDNHSRNRYHQPHERQVYNGQISNDGQLSNGQRFNGLQRSYGHPPNGQQRSYASATRAGPRTYGNNSSRQRYTEQGYKPQFFEQRYSTKYQNENYRYNSGGTTKQNQNNTRYNTQYKNNTYPTNRNTHQEKKQYNTQYKNNTYLTDRGIHQERKQSEDPDFLLKAHCIHTIIKTIHHLKNVSAEDPPPNIARMTEHLSTVIKPASPRPDTQALIEGNAKNWSFTTMLILRDHYTDEMEAQVIKLNTLSTYHWQNPLDLASSWAKRNLGRRLQDETLEQTAALLTSQIVDRTGATPAQPEQSVRPTAVGPTNTIVAQIHAPPAHIDPKGDCPPLVQVETECLIPPSTVLSSSLVQTAALLTSQIVHRTGATPAQPEQSVMPTAVGPSVSTSVAQINAPPAHIGSSSPHTSPTNTVHTMTDPKGNCPPSVDVETEYSMPLTSNLPQSQRTRQLPSLTPRGGRGLPRTPRPPAHLRPRAFNPCVVTEEDPIFNLSLEELEDALLSPVLARSPVATRSLGTTVQSQLQINPVGQPRPTLPDPMIPTRRPTKHLNTVKKIQDWGLSVGKKWLIMGDSNLARLPPFTIHDLQIDSYPGATFRHAEAIIKKATSSTVVEKVILAFGLNNRSNKVKQTSVKQLQAAVRAAKLKFPRAAIWIPVINYSHFLPHHEQQQLIHLNDYIRQNLKHIPKLPNVSFWTESDNVHWTKSTAGHMLQHWCEQVN